MNYLDVEAAARSQSELARREARYDYWLLVPRWTLHEAALLLFNHDPDVVGEIGQCPGAANLLRLMLRAGVPEPIAPQEAARWFATTLPMYRLPEPLAALIETTPAQEPAPVPAAKKHTRNRIPDLKTAYGAAYDLAQRKAMRPPTNAEIWLALKELVGDPDFEVLTQVTDTQVFWLDQDTDRPGKPVKRKTVYNHFTVIRKSKKHG